MEHFLKVTLRSDEPGGTLPVRRSQSWQGLSAEAVHINQADPLELALKSSAHYLALHDYRSSDGEIRITGHAPSHEKDIRGKMTFVPHGCEGSGWTAPVKRKNTFTAIYLDPAAMSAELDEVHSHVTLEPMLYFQDQTLSSTVTKLRVLLDETSPNSMYAETLGLLLGMEICKAQSRVSTQASRQRHGLSRKTENAIREYVEANLFRDVTLAELSELAGLSRFHFARSFKRSTGLPPHRYLLQQRVERAKELLATSTLPVSEIATAVGFPGPTPLARAFLRMTGSTLKEFERQV